MPTNFIKANGLIYMSVSDPWEKTEWGADSEPQTKMSECPALPIAPSYMSPNAGGGIAGSQAMRTAVRVHMELKFLEI